MSGRRRANTALLRLIIALLLLISLSGCDMDQSFIFFPERHLSATPEVAGLTYQDVWLTTEDGVRLHGWLVPGEADAPLILFFHGNAGNISHRIHNLLLFHRELGAHVLIFDYRGYGNSQGKPSEAGTYADARAALAWLQQQGWQPQRLIYFGRSLGAGVATQLAVEAPPAGLVLETPFPSIAAMGKRLYPLLYALLGWTVEARYDILAKIAEVRVPLLIFQGSADRIVPLAMAQEVFAAANEPKKFHLIPGAGHNNTLSHGIADYWQSWREFVARAVPAPADFATLPKEPLP